MFLIVLIYLCVKTMLFSLNSICLMHFDSFSLFDAVRRRFFIDFAVSDAFVSFFEANRPNIVG